MNEAFVFAPERSAEDDGFIALTRELFEAYKNVYKDEYFTIKGRKRDYLTDLPSKTKNLKIDVKFDYYHSAVYARYKLMDTLGGSHRRHFKDEMRKAVVLAQKDYQDNGMILTDMREYLLGPKDLENSVG